MRRHTSFWRIGGGTLLFIGLMVGAVSADTGVATNPQAITMTPSHTEVTVAPGATSTNTFSVVNEGSSDYSVTTYAAPYHVEGVDYDPRFTPLLGTTDASQWIHIARPASRLLTAHQSVNVAYAVTVPQGTAPGGYYAVLFAETSATDGVSGIVAHDQVGNILYITVAGPVKMGGAIQAMSIPPITLSSDLDLGLLVSNTGGVHFVTHTMYTVRNVFGKVLLQAGSAHYVLPQTQRRIDTSWRTPVFGLYRISRMATVAGRAQATPDAWVIVVHPWIIVLLVGIIALCIADRVVRRLRRRKV